MTTEKTSAELRSRAKIANTIFIGLAVASFVMLFAGVWADWRWFITAVLIFAISLVFSAAGDRLEEEAKRKERRND